MILNKCFNIKIQQDKINRENGRNSEYFLMKFHKEWKFQYESNIPIIQKNRNSQVPTLYPKTSEKLEKKFQRRMENKNITETYLKMAYNYYQFTEIIDYS